MKAVSKDISMWLYIVYTVVIIMILSGLTFLLASCMEEVIADSDNDQPGKKIALNFSMGDVTYDGDEVVTHSNSEMNPETVTVPLDNGLCLVATMEADRYAVTTRAGSTNLGNSVMVRIIAYSNGTTYHAHADYKVVNGKLISNTPFLVSTGRYKFVAYSYNHPSFLPVHKVESEYSVNVETTRDILWGCFPKETDTYEVTESTVETIDITMSHLFSNVAVLITAEDIGVNISYIANVVMNGKQPTLSVINGTFTLLSLNENTHSLGPWRKMGTLTVDCDPRLTYMHNTDPFLITIDTLTLQGYPTFTKLKAIFNKKLQSGFSYTVKIRLMKDESAGIGMLDEPPADVVTYAGAFWKANEKGERLIRIDMGANAANHGAWTAKVAWLDPRWTSGNGVVLDRNMIDVQSLANRGISFSTDMNPNDPEGYTVDNNSSVNGMVDASNRFIFFRIGLKSYYSPSATYPARYGVILLSYSNNTKQQRIFLRQGEDADYVMNSSDPVNTGGLTQRNKSAKFTTRNLTALTLDDQLPLRGAIFTEYPSQAGAMFQWAHPSNDPPLGRLRWAWNPYTTPATSWQVFGTSKFWNDLKDTEEVSPQKYRRPNDGLITTYASSTDISQSEFRQSLYRNPGTGYNQNIETTNSLWGYYADGFFDRRRIVNGTTVASGDPKVAYVGRLFYNPIINSDRYNASLFFPAAGYRNHSNGNIDAAGTDGMYWSSSVNNDGGTDYGCFLWIRSDLTSPWREDKTSALSIRAVAE
jgi:hypothetical protein